MASPSGALHFRRDFDDTALRSVPTSSPAAVAAMEANEQLGFEADLRGDQTPAAILTFWACARSG